MSETKAEEKLLLAVHGKLTAASYERALRHASRVRYLQVACILVFAFLLIDAGLAVYFAARYRESLSWWMREMFFGHSPAFWALLGFGLVWEAVMILVLRPGRLMKRVTEVLGEEQPWEISWLFYETRLRMVQKGRNQDAAQNIGYAQIARVRDRRYDLLIRTGARNAVSVFKEAITREEEKQILAILRERCPQVRSLRK